MTRKLVLFACAVAVACSSPTSPTATVVIDSFIASADGAQHYFTSYAIAETTGRLGITVNSATYTLPDGFQITTGPGIVPPHIAAGQRAISTRNIVFESTRPVAPQLTLTIAFTDDANHVGSASRTANVTPPLVYSTVAGVVTDGASGVALRGCQVRVITYGPVGDVHSASASTDGNGYYSWFPVYPGTVTVVASQPGYLSTRKTINISADTRLDLTLLPGMDPVYPSGSCLADDWTLGTTAICIDTTQSQAQTRAEACLMNGGVKCFVCPGALCFP
jgi:hypothetical protein